MVSESFPSLIPDLLSLVIRGLKVMSKDSILEVRDEALDSTLSSNNTPIEELESLLALNNSEFDVTAGRGIRVNRVLYLFCG